MEKVGYTGKEPFVSPTPEPGTNGLMLDRAGPPRLPAATAIA